VIEVVTLTTGDRGPALAVLEISSIARGVVAADAALKQSPAVLLASRTVSGGKHLVMLEGEVAVVQEAMGAAKRVAQDLLLDWVFLALAHESVWRVVGAPVVAADWSLDLGAQSVCIIETSTVCAAIAAVDAACKGADVTLRDVRFAIDMAGKACFTLTGALSAIEAAADSVHSAAGDKLIAAEIIAQPVAELRGALFCG
jgi:microcompartment protein CcmL/EutN